MDLMVDVKIAGKIQELQFHSINIHNKLYDHCEMVIELGFDAHLAQTVIKDAVDNMLSKDIEITIKDESIAQHKRSYKGIIIGIESTTTHLVLKAVSEDYKLKLGKEYKSFTDMDVNGICKSIINSAGIKNLNFSPASPTKNFVFFQQYNESNYDCLMRLAAYDGCVMYHDGTNLVYAPKIDIGDTIKLNEEELSDVSMECKIDRVKWVGMPYDYTQHAEISASEILSSKITPPNHWVSKKAFDLSNSTFKDVKEHLFNQSINSKSDYEKYLKKQQEYSAGELFKVTGVTYNPSVNLGASISCANNSILKDPITVTAIDISFEENVYKARFSGYAKGATIEPPYNSKVKKGNSIVEPAQVIDNLDPENLGRVNIRYLWDKEGNATAWARVIQAGAGRTKNGVSYGTHYTPRVGDQVLISCEHGDPNLPIVLGNLYHSEFKPEFVYENGAGEVLNLRTPQQTEILALEQPNEEKLLLQTREDNQIWLINDGSKDSTGAEGKKNKQIEYPEKDVGIPPKPAGSTIFIKSNPKKKGSIIIHAEDIAIVAEKNLGIQCETFEMLVKKDALWNIKGKNEVTIEKDNSVEILGKNDFTVQKNNTKSVGMDDIEKVSMNKKLTATQVKMEASATAEYKAGAQFKISSAMIESGASAMNVIKGAMVKIN